MADGPRWTLLGLAADGEWCAARSLSPGESACGTLRPSPVATGRGWRHPSPRAGGRRLERERDGSRSRRPAVTAFGKVSVMAPSRRPPRGTWPTVTAVSDPHRSTPCGRQQLAAGHTSPSAGAGRQLAGREAQGPARPQGRATAPEGASPLGLPSRHPRTRRTLRRSPRGGWRVHESSNSVGIDRTGQNTGWLNNPRALPLPETETSGRWPRAFAEA